MRTNSLILILAAVTILGCGSVTASEESDSEPSGIRSATAEVHFCHLQLPEWLKRGNASFSLVYSFEVGEQHEPTNLVKLKDDYLSAEAVGDCVDLWRLPNLKPGTEVTMVLNWKHGTGWTSMSVVADGLNVRIRNYGDPSPYSRMASGE